MNMNMGFNSNFNQQPAYKQYAVGTGIDSSEYNAITTAATKVYQAKTSPLSTNTANAIKQQIGGEWFVFISPLNNKDYDFCISSVTGGDFMSFSLDNTLYQICRLK
jgi:hypothetical protein